MKASYISHMGDDLQVVNAARVSFAKTSEWELVDKTFGTKVDPKLLDREELYQLAYCKEVLSDRDTRLINYLAKHSHWTPFAHTAIQIRASAPIPIRTQCFKHKQGFVENEESRRYITSTPELFVPTEFRSAPTDNVKQGSGGTHYRSNHWLGHYESTCYEAIKLYEAMVKDGVCTEQARFVLPQGVEVTWIWTGSLYAYANFYSRRTEANAQKEVQDLARQIGDIIKPLFPVSWRALTDAS